MNRKTILNALNSKFKDFEDAFQNYSAENSGIVEIIITRYEKDYSNSNLVVMTPNNYIKSLKASI